MSARKLILALSLLGIAAVAALLVRTMLSSQPGETVTEAVAESKVEMPRILVVASDMPVGTFVTPGGLRWQDWPEESVLQMHFLEGRETMEELEGAVVRTRVSPGEPLVRGHVVKPGERGFLAAVLNPGYLAVSVAVNAVSGNAGLIFPGDRVDLILTQTIDKKEQASPGKRFAGETVLEDLRVIAVDQRTGDPSAVAKETQPVARTVTLEVTSEQAEIVNVASDLGRLSLALRSLAIETQDGEALAEGTDAEDGDAKTQVAVAPESKSNTRTKPTWASDVSKAYSTRGPSGPKSSGVVLMRGTQTSVVGGK